MLERNFKRGMTWDNYGTADNQWCIDHIIPFAAFDLRKRKHVLEACHYTNLQPLWNPINSKKGDRLDWVDDTDYDEYYEKYIR
jgi:hypothetical protein